MICFLFTYCASNDLFISELRFSLFEGHISFLSLARVLLQLIDISFHQEIFVYIKWVLQFVRQNNSLRVRMRLKEFTLFPKPTSRSVRIYRTPEFFVSLIMPNWKSWILYIEAYNPSALVVELSKWNFDCVKWSKCFAIFTRLIFLGNGANLFKC
jgi:hypothetical protein